MGPFAPSRCFCVHNRCDSRDRLACVALGDPRGASEVIWVGSGLGSTSCRTSLGSGPAELDILGRAGHLGGGLGHSDFVVARIRTRACRRGIHARISFSIAHLDLARSHRAVGGTLDRESCHRLYCRRDWVRVGRSISWQSSTQRCVHSHRANCLDCKSFSKSIPVDVKIVRPQRIP